MGKPSSSVSKSRRRLMPTGPVPTSIRVMLVDDHPFWIDALGEDLT